MTATCAFPGCDKPVRPVPRARYCSWEHLTDATNLRERESRRKKRTADRVAAKRRFTAPAPTPAVAAPIAVPLPLRAFVDDPRASADRGSPGPRIVGPASAAVYGLGASSLVAA
jgi:hypothetical protein